MQFKYFSLKEKCYRTLFNKGLLMRNLILSMFLFIGCIPAFGQNSSVEICIEFRVGTGTVDTAYGNKAIHLQEITSHLDEIKNDSMIEPIDSAVVLQTPDSFSVAVRNSSFCMSLKNNMLYDLLAVPNIGIEFYLAKNWSIAANWMYAWWKTDKRHRYWRIYGGDIAVRKWFGRKTGERPLSGHHLGLYGQILTYDFEWGDKGYLGDRWSYAGGVEYGYSLPVARRLNIDFTLGVGYLGGEYKKYAPRDGHYVWKATKDRHWFGPTKVEVSLVWLLGPGCNNIEGGAK